jgi:uncharacterized BrkB/YihY/UPF0761 family membrane protein
MEDLMAASGNPLTYIINAIKGGNSEVQQVTGVKAPTPQSNVATAASAAAAAPAAFSSVQNALSGIYDKLTDGKMWRSLGWLLLGVVLMIMGLALILKDKIPGPAAGALAGL